MRDLTNAIVRFSWVMPLFVMKQTLDVMTFQTCSVADALNEVTDAARRRLGGTMEQAASAWEQTQQAASEAMSRGSATPCSGAEPAPGARSTSSGRGCWSNTPSGREQDWGPIPPASR